MELCLTKFLFRVDRAMLSKTAERLDELEKQIDLKLGKAQLHHFFRSISSSAFAQMHVARTVFAPEIGTPKKLLE